MVSASVEMICVLFVILLNFCFHFVNKILVSDTFIRSNSLQRLHPNQKGLSIHHFERLLRWFTNRWDDFFFHGRQVHHSRVLNQFEPPLYAKYPFRSSIGKLQTRFSRNLVLLLKPF